MSNIWQILGLDEPTADLRKIKKAYALKLRETRPEDDPDGFMRLRQALEDATRYSKFQDAGSVELPFSKPMDSEIEAAFEPNQETIEISTSNIMSTEQDVDSEREYSTIQTTEGIWRERIIQIIESPWKRGSLESWRELFEDEELTAIDVANDFKTVFRETLLEYFGYFDGNPERHNSHQKRPPINSQIGTYIFEEMGWFFPQNSPDHIQHQIEFLRQDLDVLNKKRSDLGLPVKEIPSETPDDEEGFSWILMFATIAILFVVFRIANSFGGG